MKNNLSWDVICISPKAIHKGKWLIEIIIDHAHNIIDHFGQFKTSQYIRRYFWWQSMSHDIESYCKMCSTCMTSKDTNSKPTGLPHSLPVRYHISYFLKLSTLNCPKWPIMLCAWSMIISINHFPLWTHHISW